MNSSKMYIHLFDGFTIEYGGEVFNMRDYLSRQSLSLLEVLILQDQNNVSRDFLMELFWENSDNLYTQKRVVTVFSRRLKPSSIHPCLRRNLRQLKRQPAMTTILPYMRE